MRRLLAAALAAGISLAATAVPPPDPNQPVILLVGDSVPLRLSPVFEREAERRGWRLVVVAHGWCPVTGDGLDEVVNGVPTTLGRCRRVVDKQNDVIRQYDPDLVVWWDRWDLNDFVTRKADSYHHQAGSCRMGLDELAVVDPELRVHGIEGLRVVDASIMPTVASGNTNAATIMIGEKAADMIRGRMAMAA